MSKHRLEVPCPPAKRVRLSPSVSRPVNNTSQSFDALSDELALFIFSYLSGIDLCQVQAVCNTWHRLASDNELWKSLYLKSFGRPRLRGTNGVLLRSVDGREIKGLPSRIHTPELQDWKYMYRISTNWLRGRCSYEQLSVSNSGGSTASSPVFSQVLLANGLLIAAGRQKNSGLSFLHVQDLAKCGQGSRLLPCPSKDATGLYHVTALVLDQSKRSSDYLNVLAILSTGEFNTYKLIISHLAQSTLVATYAPRHRSQRSLPIKQAVFHYPVLATLSDRFTVSIYDVSSRTIELAETLTSYTSHSPASLVLSSPTSSSYKLVLAHVVPIYPSHWSVAATELILSSQLSRTRIVDEDDLQDTLSLISTRTARNIQIPSGFIDTDKLRILREQWHRKVQAVADTQTDGKWIVLAPLDNSLPSASPNVTGSPVSQSNSDVHTTLQLYRLSLPANGSSSSPKLTFARNLEGQIGPISSLSVSDGRCISLATNGSIWVWDLEGDGGIEVLGPRKTVFSEESSMRDVVVFDDRRIITVQSGQVTVRRFDI